jgi:hypothetical protein
MKSKLKQGLLISPGYYADFWQKEIQSKFSYDTIMSAPFKPYREMWVGTPLAAFYNKYFPGQYYLECPASDPPDVYIVKLYDTISKTGRSGHGYERLFVEIVRCNLDAGEDLYRQISLKNTPAYKDMSVAVYIFGQGAKVNFAEIHQKLNSINMYPSEVKIVGIATATESILLPHNPFVITNVYPELTSHMINPIDRNAFFYYPAVLTFGQRAFTKELRDNGKFHLLPPI